MGLLREWVLESDCQRSCWLLPLPSIYHWAIYLCIGQLTYVFCVLVSLPKNGNDDCLYFNKIVLRIQ